MHEPVLAGPAVAWLDIREDGCYVDCTAGAGGHSERIAARLRGGRLLAIDRDPLAVEITRRRLEGYAQAEVVHGNYAELCELLRGYGLETVDGVLIDAGVSSMQLDRPERGFSFQEDGPLDMRMDTSGGISAAGLLAEQTAETLAKLLRAYGDVRFPGRIARSVVERRDHGKLNSTRELADAVRDAVPRKALANDEVRQVFQAVRIAVNDELGSLDRGLHAAMRVLGEGGRLVVIAFHSGEDRIVKRFLQDQSRAHRVLHVDGRVKEVVPPLLRVLTKKPVVPDVDEVRANPRAHSARLRAAERLG
ncbi:MAG TPA: 16S rRNA (cytosine(1402)-N(4))-methyltransferase RsmH [Candidatus Hydrogenedentes bacterium]|nr:16S rRNA (cytosine(1402)-N(4))-methyltransferase RsmH [Candidatus Hydrogenedentota bacterium]